MNAEDMRAARAALRAEMKRVRAAMGDEMRARMSADACACLLGYLERMGARRVMAYASMRDELDIWGLMAELLRRGTRVFLPRVLAGRRMAAIEVYDLSALEKHAFGAMAPPVPPEMDEASPPLPELDAVIVPALAYDCFGYRLGYGAGYYDRFLPRTRALAIGLVFGCQVVRELPRAEWDVPVRAIVTEAGAVCAER